MPVFHYTDLPAQPAKNLLYVGYSLLLDLQIAETYSTQGST